MKKSSFLILTFALLFVAKSNAQLAVNIALGSRPQCHSERFYYDQDVDYYFLPEIQAYFDNRSGAYVYFDSGYWVRSGYLPDYCRNYDINRGAKVAITYRGNAPYEYFYSHKQRYCHNYNNDYNNEREHNYRRNNDDRENRRYTCESRRYHRNKHYRENDDD
jgi:hypothetical protein